MINVNRMDVIKFNEDGQYGENPAWGISDQNRVIFRCVCGHLLDLSGWDIDSSGKVTPSIHHIDEYCGFHDFLTLNEYKGE